MVKLKTVHKERTEEYPHPTSHVCLCLSVSLGADAYVGVAASMLLLTIIDLQGKEDSAALLNN